MKLVVVFGATAFILSPVYANAGILSLVGDILGITNKESTIESVNSQNMPLLQAVLATESNLAKGGGDITIVDDNALLPEVGPSGTQADFDDEKHASSGQISIYIVREGDSLAEIAKMFGVSVNTISWANGLKGTISKGQKLIILPVSGIQYTVKSGDTVKSIAKKHKGDIQEILTFNGLADNSDLKAGDTIIIPDGEVSTTPKTSKIVKSKGSAVTKNINESSTGSSLGAQSLSSYFVRPVITGEGRRSQGLHGYNGVDIAGAIGTKVVAAAAGDVIVSRDGGWNGGYGTYIVIQHNNGTQTLYGHLSGVVAEEGWHVTKGQTIGYMGNTGRSTGSHLHFEVRGGRNPF